MSALAAYQRAMVTLAFAEDDARPNIPGFELYRDMIRTRLFDMARVAYAQSFALSDLKERFAQFLADQPPSSPYIREVIAGFGPYAETEAEPLRSMLRFETAKWQVSSAPYPVCEVGELEFEGRLVVNPTLLRVSLAHVVTEDARPEPHVLFVYRRPDDDGVLWSRLPRLAALLEDEAPERKLSERVSDYFARGCDTADEQGLTRLADELTLAVDRGIVLGTAP